MCPPNFYVEAPTSSTLEFYLIWIMGLYRGNQVKIRSLEWALIQYDQCPQKRGRFSETCIERRQCEQIQGEDDHIQIKQTGLKQILPSEPSEGTNPANTLILDF